MTDIPKLKTSKLGTKLADVITAAEAVREGIATHVQKHRAAQHAAREAVAANRKLEQRG